MKAKVVRTTDGPSEARVTDAIHAFVVVLQKRAYEGETPCVSLAGYRMGIEPDNSLIREAMTAALMAERKTPRRQNVR